MTRRPWSRTSSLPRKGGRSKATTTATLALLGALLLVAPAPAQEPVYVRKPTRSETLLATLAANRFPTLQGKWHWIGPFDNAEDQGFDAVYPPERGIDLGKTHPGKAGKDVGWKEFPDFKLGTVVNLGKLFRNTNDAVVYLHHEVEVREPTLLPLSLGSDDSISVWLNGDRLLHENAQRPAAPDQNRVELKLRPGANKLLIKVCNNGGDFAVYVQPELPKALSGVVRNQFARDFPPPENSPGTSSPSAEAAHYRIVTIPEPSECVLEVGGLGFRPDGKLLACTRRGEVWLIHNPLSDNPADIKFTRFATGLHEALGLTVEDNHTVYVTQRPELTKLVDRDGDGVADEYTTVCDKWGVSGDYHEFAFGAPRDKDGNFYVTLNVGFGGGHQAKGNWRGWCVKITPQGEMEPFAVGLRSPNGLSFSPDGDLFYCDNQGEWVASNKMHHIKKGDFFGHPAGLRFLKDSPLKGKWPDDKKLLSGMLYDGQKGPNANSPSGLPGLSPPCIWFPYGRMGQSASEPRWDSTVGKFGPFAGQCFVGDQTKSNILRIALEKVNGEYQGACFPFRSGFQCGINRLVFAPDGSLFAGQTNRGWGSVGGKPQGLQRAIYTGVLPFEIHTMSLTPTGFDLTFTKPLDRATAERLQGYSLRSFTYVYFSNYGSPEVDQKAEKVAGVEVAPDRKSVTLKVENLRRGRVYELRLDGLKSADGDPVLHPEAYYTLNHLR